MKIFTMGFTKKDDLRYFTKVICGIEFVHLPGLAPTADILDFAPAVPNNVRRLCPWFDRIRYLQTQFVFDVPFGKTILVTQMEGAPFLAR